MTRISRILTTANSSAAKAAAPPPEAVAMESDFLVILAALLCALICLVGLIAVARCTWLRRGSGPSVPSAANKGLKKKVLQSLPKFRYTPETNPKFSDCPICLGEFAEGDEIRVLPQCGHGFHVGCIDTWLGSHSSCPSCRQILVVARCRKCGEFPAAAGDGGREAELKARQDLDANIGSAPSFLP